MGIYETHMAINVFFFLSFLSKELYDMSQDIRIQETGSTLARHLSDVARSTT